MKKTMILIFSMVFLLGLMGFVSSANVCCERTVNGFWCQNIDESQCSTGINPATGTQYDQLETSCEATSFCKLGTCVNVQEGKCMENTPESVCTESGGIWKDQPADEIAQCDLGCCFLADQAAFVTQTRCKKLSANYGLETIFRTDIKDEVTCIASANPDEEGACVFETEFEKTCLRSTREKCMELKNRPNIEDLDFEGEPESIVGVNFYGGELCSSTELGTNCGPSDKTTCVEGKDQVYYLDTCGNIANIYDSTKRTSEEYWAKIIDKTQSCNYGKSNADSASCGNCDYYAGSTCKTYKINEDKRAPSIGDNICRDLACVDDDGKRHEHGTSWCSGSSGIEDNLVGSRAYRLVCYDNEISVEPCAEYRGEICIESDFNGYPNAQCKVNAWRDCLVQNNSEDCLNEEYRDCQWINSGYWRTDNPTFNWGDFELNDFYTLLNDDYFEYACVPKYAPGYDFWQQGDAQIMCDIGTQTVLVRNEKGLGGGWECKEGCYATKNEWHELKIDFCHSLGDCGGKLNFIEEKGYLKDKNAYEKIKVD